MRKEWQQSDYILEDCPIHGYKVTKIPINVNYKINLINQKYYSNNDGPKIFPPGKIITHSISNNSFRNSSRGNPYCQTQVFKNEDSNNVYKSYGNLSHYDSSKEYSNNYSFFISGTSKLKPKVTINNVSYQYKNPTINNYNQQTSYYNISPYYNYSNRIPTRNVPKRYKIIPKNNSLKYCGEDINENRTILNNNNKSEDNYYIHSRNFGMLSHDQRIIQKQFNNQIPLKTEAEENFEKEYKYNKRRNYYLTPNYYSNVDQEEDELNPDNKRYYLRRNVNNPNPINENINQRRRINENDIYPNRKYIYDKIENRGIKDRKINENNYKYFNRTDFDIKEKIISEAKNLNYKNKKKLNSNNIIKKRDNEIKEDSLIVKNLKNKRNREISNRDKEIKTKIINRTTNLNNHKVYISNNKGNNFNIINKIPSIPKKIDQTNKQILENIYQNIREQKLLKKKFNYIKEKKQLNNKDYSMKIKRSNLYNEYVNEKTGEMEINKKKDAEKDKNEKIERHIEKYYDSEGNWVGGKNILITKKYNDGGEKVEKEIIKEEYKPNFKNIFKKYVPKKEEEGIFNQEEEKFFPYQINIDKLKKERDIIKNIEEDENKYRVTFGIKRDNLRLEVDDNDEKQADEQKIEVNSELDDENTNNQEKENNDENNKLILENVPYNIINQDKNQNNINVNQGDKKNINKEKEN